MATQNSVNNTNKITTFTSSGTWTKDARSKYVTVYGWGGGGGGGSGRRGTVALSSGGSGGGVSYFYEINIPASTFAASETITIGAGGAGGAARTSDNTDGLIGSEGGQTKIGTKLVTANTPNGQGGSTSTVSTGANEWYLSSLSPITYVNTSNDTFAGQGKLLSGGTPVNTCNFSGAPGGGGGGATVALGDGDGGTGGSTYSGSRLYGNVLAAGGAYGHQGASPNGSDGAVGGISSGRVFGGGGGGGGGGTTSTPTSAGNGGTGGVPGGGGGGGGGSVNGVNSGAGGTGGNGQITIIEFF